MRPRFSLAELLFWWTVYGLAFGGFLAWWLKTMPVPVELIRAASSTT